MDIIPIYSPHLYSIAYDKEDDIDDLSEYLDEDSLDELTKCLYLWTNPLYLYEYFDKNQQYLLLPYWENITVEEAVNNTVNEANILANEISNTKSVGIEEHFHPLNTRDTLLRDMGKAKLKRKWLRIYALKIDKDRFIVTGGAIKLTIRMEDNEYTQKELNKLKKVFDYLHKEGVFDGDSFDEYLYEISI